jgi:hypothetical protein
VAKFNLTGGIRVPSGIQFKSGLATDQPSCSGREGNDLADNLEACSPSLVSIVYGVNK